MGLFNRGPRGQIAKIDDNFTKAKNKEERYRACNDGITALNRIEQDPRLKEDDREWLNNLRKVLMRNLKDPNDSFS